MQDLTLVRPFRTWVLAHPLQTKAIASARIKTDKIDETTLAHLLRTDLVPAVYIPPRAVRDRREILRYHASLVRWCRNEQGQVLQSSIQVQLSSVSAD